MQLIIFSSVDWGVTQGDGDRWGWTLSEIDKSLFGFWLKAHTPDFEAEFATTSTLWGFTVSFSLLFTREPNYCSGSLSLHLKASNCVLFGEKALKTHCTPAQHQKAHFHFTKFRWFPPCGYSCPPGSLKRQHQDIKCIIASLCLSTC